MIDQSDGDDMFLVALLTDGWPGLVVLAIAVIFWIIASSNADACAKRTCPAGSSPRLMDHQCLCVTTAK